MTHRSAAEVGHGRRGRWETVSVSGRGHLSAREWRPGPAPGPRARAVTGLRIDGGTAFGLWTDESTWNPRFAMQFRTLLDAAERGELEQSEAEDVTWPLPCLPGGDAPTLTGLGSVLEDGSVFVDWRRRGFGDEHGWPVATVYAKGHGLVLHFRDRAFVRFTRKLNNDTGEVSWYVRVEAKHRELYERDVDRWLETWLGYFTWSLQGEWKPVHQLRDAGWSTTQMHLNCDFVGLEFTHDDAGHVLGKSMREVIGTVDLYPDEADDDDDPLKWAQTLVFGRKASDSMLVGYRKGDQLRQAKGIRPEASAYAVHWRAAGWSPELDGDPYRIELRVRKKGLVYRERTSDRIVYDFRDPALMCSDKARRAFWSYATHKRRLVTQEEERRFERQPTDPRWLIVQAAAGLPEPAAIRQLAHEFSKKLRAERVAFDEWNLLRALMQWCADRHDTYFGKDRDGVSHATAENLAAALEVMAADIRRRGASGSLDLEAIGEGIFARPRSLTRESGRMPARVQAFVGELIGEHDLFARELIARGGDGALSIIEQCGPPAPLDDDNPAEERNES